MPERIQLRRTKGWRKPEGAVVVARPSRWGNPFKVGDEISPHEWLPDVSVTCAGPSVHVTQQLAVDLFRVHVEQAGWSDWIRAELAGKDLCCWCRLSDPCHGDVLLEIANAD